MATQHRADPARTKPYPNKNHPDEIGPDDVPSIYGSICVGNCLEPVFHHGDCLVFSKTEPPEPGDYVGFWLHPNLLAPGELPRWIKRLVLAGWPGMTFPYVPHAASQVEPFIVLEQLNPLTRFKIRASHILAMHKVIGQAEDNGDGTARLHKRDAAEAPR